MDSYRLASLTAKVQPPPESVGVDGKSMCVHPPQRFIPVTTDDKQFCTSLLNHMNAHIIRQHGDGNCLFRAVAYLVYGDASVHDVVRAKCLEIMTKNKNYFQDFISADVDAYLTHLKKDAVWGGHTEIHAMSALYQRPIHVLSLNTAHPEQAPLCERIGHQKYGHALPVLLSYHKRSHYNAIVSSVTNGPNASLPLTCLPGVYEDYQIEHARPLGYGVIDQVKSKSDRAETDRTQMSCVLSASRIANEQLSAQNLQKAMTESLESEQELQDKRILHASLVDEQKAEQKRLHAALAASEQDHDQTQRPTKRQKVDNRILEAVLAQSLQECPALNHCHVRLGFPLEACRDAYAVMKQSLSTPAPTEVMVALMLQLLTN